MRKQTLVTALLAVLLLPAGRLGAQNPPPKLKVPETVVFEPDVEYASPDGQHLKVDLAHPKSGEGPFPAVVCIHGGGFRAGTRQSYDGLCLRLAEQGYVAITVEYRLAPKYPFPAAVHDCSDFTKSYGKSVDAAEVLPLFLGGNLETARRQHVVASPLYWVTPHAAPTLCIHGTEDKYVAHEQAVWLVDRLKAAEVEADLLTLEGAGHGFKGKDAEIAEKAMLAFFEKHLKK
jgi:acetyl esterase/lipase